MMPNAACCLAPGAKSATGDGGSNTALGLPGLSATVTPAGNGVVSKVEQALQAAIHGSGSVSNNGGGNGGGVATARVIPFPTVDPYSPIRKAGRPPVAGYTAFPAPESTVQPYRNRRVRRVTYMNAQGTENAGAPAKPSSKSGFVDLVNAAPAGIGLNTGFGGLGDLGLNWPEDGPIFTSPPIGSSGGPSTLQTILGTIQTTLPATVAAFRASPQNIYPGSYQTAYPQGVAPTTGGAAEGVGAGVGSAVDTLGNTVSRFVTEHPYLVIGGGAALVLWFMNPPRRRR